MDTSVFGVSVYDNEPMVSHEINGVANMSPTPGFLRLHLDGWQALQVCFGVQCRQCIDNNCLGYLH